MHFEVICSLKTELNYPFKWSMWKEYVRVASWWDNDVTTNLSNLVRYTTNLSILCRLMRGLGYRMISPDKNKILKISQTWKRKPPYSHVLTYYCIIIKNCRHRVHVYLKLCLSEKRLRNIIMPWHYLSPRSRGLNIHWWIGICFYTPKSLLKSKWVGGELRK